MNPVNRLIAAGVTAAGALAAAYLIIPAEGEALTAYPDHLAGGVVTGCYGQTQKGFYAGQQFTVDECLNYLADDLIVREAALNRLIHVPVTDYQYSTFLDHSYQFGLRAFETSTMRRKLNSRDYTGACLEFTEAKNSKGEAHGWVYTSGKNCRIRSNNCYGMVLRAERNRDVCLGKRQFPVSGVAF